MLLYVPDQFLDAVALVITGTLVMHMAKGPLNRVRFRAVGGPEQQREAGMPRPPPLDRLGLGNALVVHDPIDFIEPRFGGSSLQTVQQRPAQHVRLASPHAMP